ncbi:periplasmic heavy metal sensor [Gellertiella hungarica]|uniref:Putative membrane protein n=1 Tax=Gellertiella hungarica TaxID=1572859 RepID=A0A7W6J614_9HYPH|nr:periplasmic heavy metal sensor [Gellertiella hungarica]MBB4065443.1 putative membrane protein [Gellertiella hungarica]
MRNLSPARLILAVLLGLSLAGNFFLLGYVLKVQRDEPVRSMLADRPLGGYSEDVRREFRRLLKENRVETARALRALREARRDLSASAGATPVREDEVREAMARVRRATDELQRLMQDLLLEALRAKDRNATPRS